MIVSELTSNNFSGFIVFEGVNGAGKGTLINEIAQRISAQNIPVIQTFEPGATALGAKIRNMLLGQSEQKLSELSELLLFAADRAEHVHSVIAPNLNCGKAILCDRYYYSTSAFQGYGRGIDLELINSLNSVATQGVLPDLVILLDLDPAEGLRRAAQRENNAQTDSFEQEDLEFHNEFVQASYKLLKNALNLC